MGSVSRPIALMVLLLGVAGVVIGSVFIAQAVEKNNWMKAAMQQEQVTFGLSEEAVAEGEVIDTAAEAQAAGDTIREHRRNIAPTYEDLLAGEHYDPTNPEHLSYAQALNMENYLYLAVLGFGVTTVVMGTGIFMIITGVGLVGAGILLFRLAGEAS